MKKYSKLAIYGGTFSPVHNGHISAVMAFYKAIEPDVMYVIPTAVPPHKERHDSATDIQRLEMLEAAFSDIPKDMNIEISDMEMLRGGKSYTVDTVSELLNCAETVYVCCGTDMFITLDSWHDAKRLLKLAVFVCMSREDDFRLHDTIAEKAELYKTVYGAEVILLSAVPFEVSSSEIRERIMHGESIEGLVPEKVNEYIKSRGLYIKQ